MKQTFDRWVKAIGQKLIHAKDLKPLRDESKYVLLFFADIMTDDKIATHENLPAELISKDDKPAFLLEGIMYRVGDEESYRSFWTRYDRPPHEKHRNYLLERGDSLIPLDERKFKGAFYTPLKVVDKAYDSLTKTLGANWQQDYYIWDMCCGVGNLEVQHSHYRKIFMSTLNEADVEIMKSTKTCVGAERFQYDYLNDDITDDGEIDYTLTNKVPQELRDAIKAGKKILVLMNPPYAEASNTSRRDDSDNKEGVANTKIANVSMQKFGKASNELFTQFLARITIEIPNATIAMFSKLKYVNAPNFEEFRQNWNAKYLDGFIVHSKAFDGLSGDFPIGFLIWQTHPRKQKEYAIGKISTEILDDKMQPAGRKAFYNTPNKKMLNHKDWINRPTKNNTPVLPLKNAVSPATSKAHLKHWSDGAIGYMSCAGNDFQQAKNLTSLYSSCFGNGHGFYVTRDNLEKAAMTFTVRRIFTVPPIMQHAWAYDRDQFLIPTKPLTDEFKNDCLIWMLFNNSNLTAGADRLEWDTEEWSLVNCFIPFSEREVNANKKFESAFMAEYLEDKKLSTEALGVMAEGRKLWQDFFAKTTDQQNIRTKYQINRSDAGWYQIRNFLKERNKIGAAQTDFTAFEQSYQILSDKLRPMVFDLGFLAPNN